MPTSRAYIPKKGSTFQDRFPRKGGVRVYQGPPVELASDPPTSKPALQEMESPKSSPRKDLAHKGQSQSWF